MISISTMYRITRKRWQWPSNSIRTKDSYCCYLCNHLLDSRDGLFMFLRKRSICRTISKSFQKPRGWHLHSIFCSGGLPAEVNTLSIQKEEEWDACPDICQCTTSLPLSKFSGTKHWATRLVTLYRRPDRLHILLSSFWKRKQRKSAEWNKDESFRAMVGGKRSNLPCLGACLFPTLGEVTCSGNRSASIMRRLHSIMRRLHSSSHHPVVEVWALAD